MTSNLQRTTKVTPTWCPGCGNYAIFGAIKTALDELNLTLNDAVFTYDVGCSGNMADFLNVKGFHGLHGRAIPVAAGIKLANYDLKVFSVIGDGGCFGEGIGHFIEACRANHDLVVISHDNFLYSLTTGQKSPTTPQGTVTPSTPRGAIEAAFNPIANALVNHATFVGRGFAGNISHLTKLLVAATKHIGFSFVDVLQPCPTFNKTRPYSWYREHIYDLHKTKHDPADFNSALAKSLETAKLPIGIFYETNKPAFHQHFPILKHQTLVSLYD
ncbi:MAG: thiamine pyrophosphate-dependent enzyme [Candidatus Beckwithbacteria bacterium]|nr:thiamine pyrophosphate-dependent enzyme [Candidatus Beckwithbacteria bacterium]